MRKAIHKNLGEVEIIGEDIDGRTMVKTKDGQIVEASTPYLKPLSETPPTKPE
jgi:hypothetical protein